MRASGLKCVGEHVHVAYVEAGGQSPGFFLKRPLSYFSKAGSLRESEAHRFDWLASEPGGSFCLC